MKRTAALLVFLAAFSAVLSAQTWKGTISKQGDVVVVKNPKTPMYPAESFRFKEELSIGGESLPAEAAFGVIRDLDVAADGRIYIADIKQGKILVFESKGTFLLAFGKKGQGPGEFLAPVQLSIGNARHDVFVDGMRKGVVFDLDGKFKVNVVYPAAMMTVRSDDSGALAGTVMVGNGPEGRYELIKTTGSGSSPLILARAPITDLAAPDPFMPRLAWDLRADGTVVEGLPERYEIKIHDAAGKVDRLISREYDPVPVMARDEEEYLKSMPPGVQAATAKPRFSKRFPAFRRIIADERGWLFVQTNERASDGKSYITDIFDPDGRYIARFGEGGMIYRVRGGKVYSVKEDAEGYQIVKRYAIEWTR
jgi:hypothetical protein